MVRLLSHTEPRTNYCKRSLSYSGVVLWNSLPLNIRKSLSLNEFNLSWRIVILTEVLYKFYFVFIHGFLVKQVFIISLIVVVIYNINLVR